MRLAHSLAMVAAVSRDRFEDLRRNIDPEWLVIGTSCASRWSESLKTLILPPRRSERRFPRAVKIKMSNYSRERRKGSK